MIGPKNSATKAGGFQQKPQKFGVAIRILLGLTAGFMLWQENSLADYFAYIAVKFLFPSLVNAPAVQYASMSFVVVLGFSACMSLAVALVFFLTRVARLVFSRFFFSPANSASVS